MSLIETLLATVYLSGQHVAYYTLLHLNSPVLLTKQHYTVSFF